MRMRRRRAPSIEAHDAERRDIMLNLLAVLIYLGLAFLVYRLLLKDRDDVALGRRAFLGTLLRGILPCTLCIIIFELSFDRFILKSSGSLRDELLTSFFRAALIEEAFKMVFSLGALKKWAPASRIGCMLLCGMVGAGYGLVEKAVLGGGVILIVNAFLPLHIFFQFLMGALLYDARKAAEEGNVPLKRKKTFLAFLLPFLVHGLWDSLLSVAGWLMDMDGSTLAMLCGFLLFAALISGGIVAEVRVIRRMKKAE